MIKKIAITFLFSMFFTSLYAGTPSWQKKSGWKDIELYANSLGGTEKDLTSVIPNNTFGAYWAGRLTEFYWSKEKSKVTTVRVRVTWSSDSKHAKACGEIVELPIDGYKDFKFRSFAMKECK
jgi:hypothetical protein